MIARTMMLATVMLFASAAKCIAAPPTIEWDASTMQLIAEDGDYGRMARLGDGRIACVFDRDAKMWIRHSQGEGATWAAPILVAEAKDCWLTNAELLPLKTGDLLYFWNERPIEAVRRQDESPPPTDLSLAFHIKMSRSADHGRTWSTPQTIYTAGVLFGDGCWEPAALELPTGEVQVFFANESPYRTSSEQEITRMFSSDKGETWSDPLRVSFRPKHRDGMPAPLLLTSGDIVVAIEDNGLVPGGVFKPVIVDIDSGERWSALKEPLRDHHYGGAPCLRRLPGADGETLLSFQQSDDGTLRKCRMVVAIGDSSARGFTNISHPFPAPTRGNQAWNSLFIKDKDTVIAISTARFNDKRGIWAIDGRVVRKAE